MYLNHGTVKCVTEAGSNWERIERRRRRRYWQRQTPTRVATGKELKAKIARAEAKREGDGSNWERIESKACVPLDDFPARCSRVATGKELKAG